jgi:hypothetical protein
MMYIRVESCRWREFITDEDGHELADRFQAPVTNVIEHGVTGTVWLPGKNDTDSNWQVVSVQTINS